MYDVGLPCIIMLFALFPLLFSFFSGVILPCFPLWMLLIDLVCCNGKNFRMKRCSNQAGDGTPVHRSARQAGQSPEDLPPPPPQTPTTDQIMRMFEEKRNQDLMEFLKSMQTMVGQNHNHNGSHSRLSDFQRTKQPNLTPTRVE